MAVPPSTDRGSRWPWWPHPSREQRRGPVPDRVVVHVLHLTQPQGRKDCVRFSAWTMSNPARRPRYCAISNVATDWSQCRMRLLSSGGLHPL